MRTTARLGPEQRRMCDSFCDSERCTTNVQTKPYRRFINLRQTGEAALTAHAKQIWADVVPCDTTEARGISIQTSGATYKLHDATAEHANTSSKPIAIAGIQQGFGDLANVCDRRASDPKHHLQIFGGSICEIRSSSIRNAIVQ